MHYALLFVPMQGGGMEIIMEYKEQIHNYVVEHKEEILKTLKELVKIPSVRGVAEPEAPFGKACADALEYTEKQYSQNGFERELNKQDGYLLSYFGNGKRTMGLFAHADVVDVSDDWVHTTPFVPIEKDGYLIGRGVLDDKSAVVISLYSAKILKELNIPFNSRLVMFTGANEETGMADIEEYSKKHTAPDFSLICDTAFPLYRGDKSMMNFWVTLNTELKDIKNFHGGNAMNIILDKATADVNGETVTETGISSHSALPEGSVNAGYLLAKNLSEREDICESDREQMLFLMSVLEKYYGEAYGIEHCDECGKLTCTNGIIKINNKKIMLGFNMRFGLSANTENIKKSIISFFEKNNCTVEFEEEKKGYIISEDNKYIQACLKAYSNFTGDKNPQVYINAGGTYARKLPCAAEIGTTLKWGVPENTPLGHGGAHQSDECINIEGFLEALELTLQMLIDCDKTEE